MKTAPLLNPEPIVPASFPHHRPHGDRKRWTESRPAENVKHSGRYCDDAGRLRPLKNRQQGSVLILTLLMVSLLMVLSLSFVAQIRLEVRSMEAVSDLHQSRADARLALHIAIAELQMAAGPDKRITGTAALPGYATHPHWTGVWRSDSQNTPNWLVSGSATPEHDPNDSNLVVLVPGDTESGTPPVQAPLIPSSPGRKHAWWVGDEGVKARVNIAESLDEVEALPFRQRAVRARTPMEPDLISLGSPWDESPTRLWFARNEISTRGRMHSRKTLDLATANVPRSILFHELTVFGYGLPVNVKDGGMKADWSTVLDSSMEGSRMVRRALGANPIRVGGGTTPVFDFPDNGIFNPNQYFLSTRIGTEVAPGRPRTGPHLGILWNYGKLWSGVENNQMNMLPPRPGVSTNLREAHWLPYKNLRVSPWNADIQHTNTPVAPVLSHLQFSFRLRSRPETNSEGESGYVLQLEMKPVIGFWNPYNVGIKSTTYHVEMMIPPMIRVKIEHPNGEEEEITSWLRLNWARGSVGSILPTPDNAQGGLWFGLITPAVDFNPGEVRLFSLDETTFVPNHVARIDTFNLVPRWRSEGSVVVDLRIPSAPGSTATREAWVPKGSLVWFDDVYLQDTHHPDTQIQFPHLNPNASLMWLTVKQGANFLSRYVDLWNGGNIQRAAGSDEITVPARVVGSSSNKDPVLVDNLTAGNHHIATWAFHQRTTTQIWDENAQQRIRGVIDGTPRSLSGNSRWEGVAQNFARHLNDMESLNAFASWIGSAFEDSASLSDRTGGNRGLVGVGGAGTQSPPTEPTTAHTRWRGFLGPSNNVASGFTHLPLFDVPREPLVSVGQFQHAQLSRYNFEPAFAFGNSYASIRIPTNRTVAVDFAGIDGFDLYDLSYDLNLRIWDEIFFSTLAPDYVEGAADFGDVLRLRSGRPPNPRMKHLPLRTDNSLDDVIAGAGPEGERGAEALASRIGIRGAFNINSTSKTAWRAVLASMVSSEIPVLDPETGNTSWDSPHGIRFSRFGHTLNGESYASGDSNSAAFWQGWRQLSPDDLDLLAGAIVEEVKARGPFRSMSEFVNRNPFSPTKEHQRKGALQSALDRTVNIMGHGGIGEGVGNVANTPSGDQFSNAVNGESNAAGYASYVLQGDVLQSLAPILQARSDIFLIRAYSEQKTHNGESKSGKVWCEAVVQRTAEYLEPSDEPWRNAREDALHPVNQRFGRRFKIISFRWLDASEFSGEAPQ